MYTSTALLNHGGSCWELAYQRSGWFLSVSATSFGCYLFEENRRKCALILASGQPASGRRWEGCWYEGCSCLLARDLRGKHQMCPNRTLYEWLTLISPLRAQPGTLRGYSPEADGQCEGLKISGGDRNRNLFVGAEERRMRERNNTLL